MGASKELAMLLQEEHSVAELQPIMQMSKAQLSEMVTAAYNLVKDGEFDESKAMVNAAKFKFIGTELEKLLRPICEEKQKEKRIALYHAEINRKETGVSWDFSNCNDPIWNEHVQQFEFYKSELKKREEFLKTVTKAMPIIIEETGEVVTINPPIRNAKDGIEVKLK
jgi:hypothetical protein